MSMLEKAPGLLMKITGPISLAMKRRAPELLMAAGVTGVLASGVLLVRQTLKVQPILEEHQEELHNTKSAMLTPTFSEEDQRKEVAKVYAKTALRLVRHYGPTISIGLGGLTCLLASNGILRQRNVALVAAYKAVESSFSKYRERVSAVVGEEIERDIYLDHQHEEIEDEETGEIKKIVAQGNSSGSIYARFFDEFSDHWAKTPEYNLIFLRQQQNYWNDILQARKHVFLSEVYKSLGIPITQASQVVGWTLGSAGDNYIDFGIYDLHSEEARAFVNGYEKAIRLDFNVDGVILESVPAT